VEIEFPEMKGPEIEMRFVRLASGKIAMQLKPTFVEAANRNYPLTIPSLQKITDAQQKNAVRAQTILNNASTQMTVAQGSLQRLQASNPSTIEEQNQARQQIAAARATISRLSSIIAEANDDLVRAQARLSAVPDIRSFLDSMHRTAQIKYTIFARAGAHEILLVDGAGP